LELLSDDALRHTLNVMLDESPEEVYAFIVGHVEDAQRREHWVRTLPESALARLCYLLEPRMYRVLLDAAEVLASAWVLTAATVNPALAAREVFWSFMLEFLARTAKADRSLERLVAAFFEYMAARYLTATPEAAERRNAGATMLEHAGRLAGATGQTGLRAIIQRDQALLLAPWEAAASTPSRPKADSKSADKRQADEARRTPTRRGQGKTAFSMPVEQDEATTAEPIYISNAGLALTGPFLPHLFQTLSLLEQDEKGGTRLRDRAAISRAVHLLQYMVDGRTNAPEPLLVLNKILCGVSPSTPIEPAIEITDQEREVCERLLKSMIANWKTISNTSIAGLQETFLRRDGKLERKPDEGWKLKVQRKTVDVLVDQIPWSISIIFHRWMPQALYVDW
jgi:Contractile injection system tape measure protein